ncbi:hypothetical protein ABZX51_006762 [Aspergillus tubingensis]
MAHIQRYSYIYSEFKICDVYHLASCNRIKLGFIISTSKLFGISAIIKPRHSILRIYPLIVEPGFNQTSSGIYLGTMYAFIREPKHHSTEPFNLSAASYPYPQQQPFRVCSLTWRTLYLFYNPYHPSPHCDFLSSFSDRLSYYG